ncbi:two-component system, NarL family, sensor histidine kinase DesK [Streptomyces sp. 2112.3]|uniref:sensor histidine kinase n=1 Tax=Streptomyces sp. 2112.3 TaxID=1881023 RepID=UPI0008949570|nr:histidine kinase [Streptomyces sp. 2112.3]SEE79842.1 two-component system, NarL family, sensor histidine kinase DesK [Streptomyces sp. 2112.3]
MVEAYFRWTLYALPWLPAIGGVMPVVGMTSGSALPVTLAVVTAGLNVVQAVLAVPLFNRALNSYLKLGATPRGLLLVSGVLTLAAEIALVALIAVNGIGHGHTRDENLATVFIAVAASLTPFFMAHSLLVSKRGFLAALAAAATGLILVLGVLKGSWLGALAVASLLVFAGLWSFVIARPTGWLLGVVRKLDAARGTEARLAVAEERLRFGRDLHDVMGRNLAVIALKSELAVQLARRERPEAVEQMVEVQRIAQDSQREVREVVRGYRKADLRAELAGARSILRAAGVDCRIEGEDETQLPPEVESALGWVVREGTTNVLRHAAAVRHCAVRTLIDPHRSVLVMTMENDGVTHRPDPTGAGSLPGSGLKGLRERLQPLGGTLASGPVLPGSYRLTVELPIPRWAVTG